MAALSLLGPTDLRAQCPTVCPPTPDCHYDAWSGPEQTSFVICVGGRPCFVTVQYCYRRACGVFNDIAITCMVFSDPSCASGYTMAQLSDLAVSAAFNHRKDVGDTNYAAIPDCPDFTVNWRVYAASCWLNQSGNLYPCAGSGQCFATYKVCRDMVVVGCNDVPQLRIKATKQSVIASGNCPQWNSESTPCLEWCN